MAAPLRLTLQRGGNLGCRMHRQLQLGFARGFEQLVLIGSDLPDLQSGDLVQAFALLERHDLVLGPAEDGGYWLLIPLAVLSLHSFRRGWVVSTD